MTVAEEAALACNLPGQSVSQPASEPPSAQFLRAHSHRHERALSGQQPQRTWLSRTVTKVRRGRPAVGPVMAVPLEPSSSVIANGLAWWSMSCVGLQ